MPPSLRGAWRTPSLRDVALTAPYMHDGVYPTLRDVLWHYNTGGRSAPAVRVGTPAVAIKPLGLAEANLDDLQAFLESLTGAPLPAKLVVSCFLLAVGGGYTAAMIQLHVQDSKSGKPMPDMHDVVLKYTGKKWFTEEPPAPESTLVCLITADENLPFSGTGTMAC